jgi:hypothetical protein
MEAGRSLPRCLFCGVDAPVPEPIPDDAVPPRTMVAFQVDADAAQASFEAFAKSRWLHPKGLRAAAVDLAPVQFPAWVWTGRLEHHYAGLVRAGTRSGKRPKTGSTVVEHTGFAVPASQTLSAAELQALMPFPRTEVRPFAPSELSVPYELGSLSERAARALATQGMHRSDAARIAAEQGLGDLSVSCLFHDLQGEPTLLPVWIGAYRYRDTLYRVVINGETGELFGKGPIDWAKVLGVIGTVVLILVIAAVFLGGGFGR